MYYGFEFIIKIINLKFPAGFTNFHTSGRRNSLFSTVNWFCSNALMSWHFAMWHLVVSLPSTFINSLDLIYISFITQEV